MTSGNLAQETCSSAALSLDLVLEIQLRSDGGITESNAFNRLQRGPATMLGAIADVMPLKFPSPMTIIT